MILDIILYIYNVHNYTYIRILYTYATLYFIVIRYRSLSYFTYFTVLYFAILYFIIFDCSLLYFFNLYYA